MNLRVDAPAWVATVLVAVLGASGPARAETDHEVHEWLDRMARAVETLNYRGTLVHLRGAQIETLRIVHRADADGIRERIYTLNGPPREILRDGGRVRCLVEGDQPLEVGGQLPNRLLPKLPLHRLGAASTTYRMMLRPGRQRVAGHDARVIEITPRDRYRYGHRFWLEQETGMLLRSELLDERGRALQQLVFVEIELGVPIADFELSPRVSDDWSIAGELIERPRAGSLSVPSASEWRPGRVPENFHLARVAGTASAGGRLTQHLLFSDGLAKFSVYVELATEADWPAKIEALGSINVFTGGRDGHRVTVIGEVPAATVEMVGRSLQPQRLSATRE